MLDGEAAAPAFGVAIDPRRPTEILVAPGVATRPPSCPECGAFLHSVDVNGEGDVLFECLNEG